MAQYEEAFELIEKYFSNFPYKTIKNKKQPLLLTGKYLKLPLEIENKLRSIFKEEEEFEAVKAELMKSPISFIPNFVKLYNDLKDEMEKISREDMKAFDDKYDKNN
ncbi:MAG: hypothetical protein ACFE9Q_03495 [Candidatus Hodarchaeota archaeon]